MKLQQKISKFCFEQGISLIFNRFDVVETKCTAMLTVEMKAKDQETKISEDFRVILEPSQFNHSVVEMTRTAKALVLNSMFPEANLYDETKAETPVKKGTGALQKKVNEVEEDPAKPAPTAKKTTKKKAAGKKKTTKKATAKKTTPKPPADDPDAKDPSVSFELYDKKSTMHAKVLKAVIKPILGDYNKDEEKLADVRKLVVQELHGKQHVLKDGKPMKEFKAFVEAKIAEMGYGAEEEDDDGAVVL